MVPSSSLSTTPGLASYLASFKNHTADQSLERLVKLLRSRQISRPRPCAIATIRLLQRIVAESKIADATQLLNRIREVGRRLQAAQPSELTLGNIVRRTLLLIREFTENPNSSNSKDDKHAPQPQGSSTSITPAASSSNLFGSLLNGSLSSRTPEQSAAPESAQKLSMKDLRDDIQDGLREILEELAAANEQIAGYAQEHIHADETILVYTASLTLQKFLLTAARKRKFRVFAVEGYPNECEVTYDAVMNGAPRGEGDEDARGPGENERYKALTTAGIAVTIVPDAAVYAIMPLVNKVFLPAHALLANGGFMAATGADVIARAAKAHSRPVVALGGIYKLSPVWPFDVESLTESAGRETVVAFSDEAMAGVEVVESVWEYVGPELCDLIVTNIGGYSPSFMYRIAADHYHQEDIDL